MNWFLIALKKYAVFSGRSHRTGFWYFILFSFPISLGLTIIDRVLGFAAPGGDVGLLSGLFALAILVPTLAVGARRLHDIGKSGWWQLIVLIPLIGAIVLIYFFVQDSVPGTNGHGPNPKGAAA